MLNSVGLHMFSLKPWIIKKLGLETIYGRRFIYLTVYIIQYMLLFDESHFRKIKATYLCSKLIPAILIIKLFFYFTRESIVPNYIIVCCILQQSHWDILQFTQSKYIYPYYVIYNLILSLNQTVFIEFSGENRIKLILYFFFNPKSSFLLLFLHKEERNLMSHFLSQSKCLLEYKNAW